MRMLTWQECAQKMIEHFSKEDAVFGWEPEENDKEIGGCVYRGNKDSQSSRRCAAGCLIPDDLYSPALEGKIFNPSPITSSSMIEAKEAWESVIALFDETALPFVRAAQTIHDQMAEENEKRRRDTFAVPLYSTQEFADVVEEALLNNGRFINPVGGY